MKFEDFLLLKKDGDKETFRLRYRGYLKSLKELDTLKRRARAASERYHDAEDGMSVFSSEQKEDSRYLAFRKSFDKACMQMCSLAADIAAKEKEIKEKYQ
jgi:hypothetical protein